MTTVRSSNAYALTGTAKCPVNGALDVYKIRVESPVEVRVEEILAVVQWVAGSEPITQEVYTRKLFDALHPRGVRYVSTSGNHSGVSTYCVVKEDEADESPVDA